MGRKYLQMIHLINYLNPDHIKNSPNTVFKNPNPKQWAKGLNCHFTGTAIQVINEYKKRFSTLLAIVCVLSVRSDSAIQGLWPTRLLGPWHSPGKNTGAGYHFLLQEIFLNQGSNPCLLCLLHWQMDSLPLMPPTRELQIKNTMKHHYAPI